MGRAALDGRSSRAGDAGGRSHALVLAVDRQRDLLVRVDAGLDRLEVLAEGLPDVDLSGLNVSGIEITGWNVPRMLNVENGRGIWCESHVFTQPHELVPGRWRFVVGDADADLVVEEFDAVPAGNP